MPPSIAIETRPFRSTGRALRSKVTKQLLLKHPAGLNKETAIDRLAHYGSHVDDALMAGLRTDVSFTVFLDDPDSYDGGELVIESAAGEDAAKLAAGSLVAYPSTTLHHVAQVTRGLRHVAAAGRVPMSGTRRSVNYCSISTRRAAKSLRAKARPMNSI